MERLHPWSTSALMVFLFLNFSSFSQSMALSRGRLMAMKVSPLQQLWDQTFPRSSGRFPKNLIIEISTSLGLMLANSNLAHLIA